MLSLTQSMKLVKILVFVLVLAIGSVIFAEHTSAATRKCYYQKRWTTSGKWYWQKKCYTPIVKKKKVATNQYDGLFQKYFGNSWRTAKAIGICESGLNPTAFNGNAQTGDNSHGIMQINRMGKLARTRPSRAWLINPENNIKYAAKMYKASGWRPWKNCARRVGAL